MKAMILAAGKGTRVRPITNTIPKPMIPLIRKPIMESIVEYLKSYGINEIMVNTSYLSSSIEDYFRDGEQFGVNIAYSFEGKMTNGELESAAMGSAGGMKKIQDFSGFFDETFIVLCGDALIDMDINTALEFHRSKKSLATIILKDVPLEETCKYGIVKTNNDGRIMQFQEKPAVEQAISTYANSGIYIFEPEIFEHIPSGMEYDIGGELFPKLAEAGLPFFGIALPYQWIDIGCVPDFWDATRMAIKGEINNFNLPGKSLTPYLNTGINVDIDLNKIETNGPIYIGSSTRIGKNVKITGPTVIGSNCIIEDGAEINESIITDYIRIGEGAHIDKKMVFVKVLILTKKWFLPINV